MPDTTPTPTPVPAQTIAVSAGRFRLVTILSIVNSVVLLLIVVAAIVHHHKMKHERDRGFADRGRGWERGFPGDFHHFHHFPHAGFAGRGGPGPGDEGGFDRPRGGGFGDDGFRPGRDDEYGPGPNRGDGMAGMGPGPGAGPMGDMAARDPGQIADEVVAHLGRQLALTDDEKAKIKPIVQADVAQFQKEAQTWHEALQKRFEDTKAKIKPLLTADQQKQLDQMPVPGGRPPGDRPPEDDSGDAAPDAK